MLSDMLFNNLVMKNVQRPLFITLNHYREGVDEPDEVPQTSRVKNLQFSNIRATGRPASPKYLRSCMIIDSAPGHYIENILLSDIHYTAVGRGTREDGEREDIPDHTGKRAECYNYGGPLPAHGLYARRVHGLRLNNLYLDTMEAETRPGCFLEDCTEGQVSPVNRKLSGSLGSGVESVRRTP